MTKGIRWAGFALIGLLGVLAMWWLNRSEPEHPTHLTLYGNIDVREVDLSFRVPGRIERVNVDEGDRVSGGDMVAVLERADFDDAVTLAEAQLAAQQALLDALTAGSRPAEIAQARANVEQAQAALVFAQATLDRQQTLAERNIASHQIHDEAQMQVDLSAARLHVAQQTQILVQQGPREEDIRAARAQRDALEVSLQLAHRRLEDAQLIAPSDGQILTRIREPGSVIAAGEPVFTLTLNSTVWARTYVDEPDLGHIHPGMPVTVTTDSGGTYDGRVGFISPTAEFTPRTVQTRELRTSLVYRVRIVIENSDLDLRQGMPVTVHIDRSTNND